MNQLSMMETLARLRLLGFALALDDWGTAYSSLDRIRNLPFSILKIDRSFVSDLESNVRARGIVSACISLAQRCKLSTVAEGVESAGQMQALKRMGCDMVQGYFIAKPMLPADLLSWLNGRSVARTSGTAAARRKILAGGASTCCERLVPYRITGCMLAAWMGRYSRSAPESIGERDCDFVGSAIATGARLVRTCPGVAHTR